MAERFADGAATAADLAEAATAAVAARHRVRQYVPEEGEFRYRGTGVCSWVVGSDVGSWLVGAEDIPIWVDAAAAYGANWDAECKAICGLIRDIFGNPFRPATIDPSWLTSTVTDLARQMYESRDFSPMPILADALQDAGCYHPDFLCHCRGPGPHVRGCWVVDLVLGKT
ncbi:MAG: hypothetical protein JWO38_4685 [Gemmataceae bacterium]|nr:hypothetical protein [Gemmataceae bacterium]